MFRLQSVQPVPVNSLTPSDQRRKGCNFTFSNIYYCLWEKLLKHHQNVNCIDVPGYLSAMPSLCLNDFSEDLPYAPFICWSSNTTVPEKESCTNYLRTSYRIGNAFINTC